MDVTIATKAKIVSLTKLNIKIHLQGSNLWSLNSLFCYKCFCLYVHTVWTYVWRLSLWQHVSCSMHNHRRTLRLRDRVCVTVSAAWSPSWTSDTRLESVLLCDLTLHYLYVVYIYIYIYSSRNSSSSNAVFIIASSTWRVWHNKSAPSRMRKPAMSRHWCVATETA